MIDVQWKGKIGYGDIVSPICYAHNVSYNTGQRVVLNFRWDTGPDYKFKPSDPETLWERANFIHSICDKKETDVDIVHLFNNPMEENHTNYDWNIVGKDRFHNYWNPLAKHRNRPEGKHIVINSTFGNQVSLKQYGKSWKDPLAGRWVTMVHMLKQKNIDVVVVDYTTPIRDLVTALSSARAFIGYHGTAAWVARFIQVPSIIIGGKKGLTFDAFPNAHILLDTEVAPFVNGIDSHIGVARAKQRACTIDFKAYNLPRKTLRHLVIS